MKLSNSYIGLPEEFYQVVNPSPVKNPKTLIFNQDLADSLGIKLGNEEVLNFFSGNDLPEDSVPIALNYAGHQFGNFVQQLGDGRAVLLGEINTKDGTYDLQLKGSGKTMFSRQGDGRSALGPVIREYILSEAMHHLGVPTSRALAAIATGEYVARETLEPGGVLTRIAKSHLRVGTFEYFASRQQLSDVKMLADFAIQRHYPEIRETEKHYLELLKKVASNQSKLISKWMSIGFIHGVMNTDNFSISGETIDYGPCAFMEAYDPDTVFSSIDRHGRYKYSNQPKIALWNLSCLAGCLLPIIDGNEDEKEEIIRESLGNFSKDLNSRINIEMTKKIGLKETQESNQLTKNLLSIMHQHGADFTLTFRSLSSTLKSNDDDFLQCFNSNEEPKDWLKE